MYKVSNITTVFIHNVALTKFWKTPLDFRLVSLPKNCGYGVLELLCKIVNQMVFLQRHCQSNIQVEFYRLRCAFSFFGKSCVFFIETKGQTSTAKLVNRPNVPSSRESVIHTLYYFKSHNSLLSSHISMSKQKLMFQATVNSYNSV